MPSVRKPDSRATRLLARMTVAEKIGQMTQVPAPGGGPGEDLVALLRAGHVGSVINEVDVDVVNTMQRVAVEESRLGIPLLIARDVIHGFRTIFPIPIGQAASWNPELVQDNARIAAAEAATAGINWTFAPMLDVTRDPRWGRIAESLGEDPYLAGRLGAAMVHGFQGDDLGAPGAVLACAKHFAGYGASEGGVDYNTANIPETELRNVHFPSFRQALDAGAGTVMASFSDLNGIPASANKFLMRQVLRAEWDFDGFVVSDWGSIGELATHGLTEGDRGSAEAALRAGINVEMTTSTYRNHLPDLLDAGVIDEAMLDELVAPILHAKFELGLFDDPYATSGALLAPGHPDHLAASKEAAIQGTVLLKNDRQLLPLSDDIARIAVIGPLADAPYEQLGTWVFDGDPGLSITPLAALRQLLGGDRVLYEQALETSRSREVERFDAARKAASAADAVLLFLGEESILSGEAHSRADIDLPGAQAALVREVRAAGRPVVAVVLAGRPLTLGNIVDHVDAILFAFHPGTMAGPALVDILFGSASPSGKLPVTFPRMVGQVPIYYAHKNTGRPPSPEKVVLIDDIAVQAPQTSLGMTAFHLDAGYEPLYPFGFGLSYTSFRYSDLALSRSEAVVGDSIVVSATVRNEGERDGAEVVQLYIRDRVASLTRPVRELKGFERIELGAGESRRVSFELGPEELGFYGRDMTFEVEPGEFDVWVGSDSTADLGASFRLVAAE